MKLALSLAFSSITRRRKKKKKDTEGERQRQRKKKGELYTGQLRASEGASAGSYAKVIPARSRFNPILSCNKHDNSRRARPAATLFVILLLLFIYLFIYFLLYLSYIRRSQSSFVQGGELSDSPPSLLCWTQRRTPSSEMRQLQGWCSFFSHCHSVLSLANLTAHRPMVKP